MVLMYSHYAHQINDVCQNVSLLHILTNHVPFLSRFTFCLTFFQVSLDHVLFRQYRE